ncbi:hypothetical protein Ae406Ps2_4824c [Pseudonocardia sp. Ae406_Ps2]|uniref:hypothetical protein n=1 Tax=unclassified Pseudonocardia TaxID=2619320 RepID=UPI00094B0B41|nr:MULTISPECIES: hypothetical protein [unclassified Pseudonocardia]OLL97463.1 hypothetical protein Ae331Ps2_1130 [Pseudonocardia sp. Ae331_Ps2]OLM04824.1 hypothetical protein Ae406Ps2_4824c [Pseudonocardia sp. Ae406_Ps2]OLM10350.1 hypothetical protein Ae505Ps2_0473 [Pseudonocardia sp. Ae505_Ps2]OLM26393.1 hypothetical protein Ae706Ps2_4826c [Pseudonocardia sp. Ae706_Ps2]OLM33520.1 hypothetical protein Ae717Ps2_4416 [Pseudonocardia sp. Ae717_Ps2]
MTATLDTPTDRHDVSTEQPFLTAAEYVLTARQLVLALAAHLARYGDTLAVKVVDPLSAIDAVMRFDGGDLHTWTTSRTPDDIAAIRARAEHIARDYFGHAFPAVPW